MPLRPSTHATMLPSTLDTMAELLSGKSLSALMANVSVHDEPAETGRCRLFAPCDISMGVLALFAGLPFCIRTAGIPAGEAEVGRSRAARILRGEQSCAVSACSAAWLGRLLS